jgi:hypothetical protein
MGTTSDDVAGTLRSAGVQGLPDSSSFLNPIVRHINRSLDVGGRLEVLAEGTVLRLQLRGKVSEVALPVAVQGFLDGFHRGMYPDLEVPPAVIGGGQASGPPLHHSQVPAAAAGGAPAVLCVAARRGVAMSDGNELPSRESPAS